MSGDVMRELDRRKPTIFSLVSIMEALIIAGLLALGTMIFQTREAVVKLTVQLDILQKQLADVPGLNMRVAQLEVRTQALEEQVKEQRQMRGLK